MNLFPIAFKERASPWTEEHVKLTGLASKREFEQWCKENRFPLIRAWLKRGQPRLVVAVGKTYESDFREAFGLWQSERHEETILGRELTWMRVGPLSLPWSPS